MGPFNGPTIAILVILALLLFGAKKLPDLARSLGRSARILKAESKGLVEDENETTEDEAPQQQARQQGPQASAPADAPQQQQGYPQLPAGQRIVHESGEPTRHTYGN
ncbi:sec-independent protein translocase protein TatA [Nocardiopsis sp. Huas11]|uniref:Sec-independent protein translocase subunit TatA n=1 Tax=Nocardiopsis sp. Huas11 TaxID=2183912 RepID=UPI000EB21B17|nr:Sec-independent protein translocase subunit TatA [Nocardiopsis sp. Huas11]RKS09498.1 sec-independent protein translocase protein TatA [Nocardiopsis sp. Huas11]